MEGSTPQPTPPTDPITEAALRSLKDIAVPPPVSWIPQTWGWALVAIVLAILAAVLFSLWLRRYRASAYRRDALAQLDGLEEQILNPSTRSNAVRSLTVLLKRVALAAWPREDVASLSGAAWVRFLSEHDRDVGSILSRTLDDAEYREGSGIAAQPPDLGQDLIAASRKWIERHHVSA